MLWWLIQNTVLAAILAGGVALACWLGRPRPAVRHALWLIVLCKLMTPPCVYWPWPVPAFAWLTDEFPAESAPSITVSPPRILVLTRLLAPVERAPADRLGDSPVPMVAADAADPSGFVEDGTATTGAPWWMELPVGVVLTAL